MSANEPAFPCGINQVYTDIEVGEPIHRGLTKREHFILEMAKAVRTGAPEIKARDVAMQAVLDADALLAQLSKEPT